MRRALLLFLLASVGCTSQNKARTPAASTLRAYQTAAPSATAAPLQGLVSVFQTPLPTATPFIYIVKSGDTMSQLAQQFHVSLDALLAANPNVNPNTMSVGQQLSIPSQPSSAGAPTPTPVPLTVKQIVCYSASDGGMWCFVLVENDSALFLEDVSVQIALSDSAGARIGAQSAALPLDILAPNSALPIMAFFAPNVSPSARPQVQILTAHPLAAADKRYLPALLQNTSVQVDPSGFSAHLSGSVSLPAGPLPARRTWIAATAYDAEGNVVGMRRWEAATGLAPGSSLPFSFTVASLAGAIVRVTFAVEATP